MIAVSGFFGACMPNIQHILFPFDFSEQTLLAAPFVRAAADRLQARITLISVLPPVWEVPSEGAMPVLMPTDIEQMERALKARLDLALPHEFAGLSVERITTSGDPALQIVEFAHSNAVDLIMMPTHGYGAFRGLLLGSVTAKVLHDAKCPVWTATHAEQQRSSPIPRAILCAVDGTPATPALMQWAMEFSLRIAATVKFLHVVPPVSDWLAIPEERELQEQVREEARVKLEGLGKSAAPDATLRVAVGRVAATVTEEARQEGADLIVIGRGSLQSTLGRLRTHAYTIIQQSPCPVLSV